MFIKIAISNSIKLIKSFVFVFCYIGSISFHTWFVSNLILTSQFYVGQHTIRFVYNGFLGKLIPFLDSPVSNSDIQ